MGKYTFLFLIVGAFLASCTTHKLSPKSQLKGGGTGGDPYQDDLGPVDLNHYAVDDIGRLPLS
ncbi:MAG: hypothetical protein RJB13_2522 [Pseudomonadota bacterium]|jgi:hypothetical protein